MNVNSLTESDETIAETRATQARAFAYALADAMRAGRRHVAALNAALDLADEWEALSAHSCDPDDNITSRDIHTYNRAGRALRQTIREAMQGEES